MNRAPTLPRDALAKALGNDLRLIAAFEQLPAVINDTQDATASNADATEALQDATVLTLSPNATLTNERVLKLGPGIRARDDGTYLTLYANDDVVHAEGGHRVALSADGDVTLALPLAGVLATRDQPETLAEKTLVAPLLSGVPERATDADAKVGEVYTLTGSTALHYRRS